MKVTYDNANAVKENAVWVYTVNRLGATTNNIGYNVRIWYYDV